jgi:hypothetical protein
MGVKNLVKDSLKTYLTPHRHTAGKKYSWRRKSEMASSWFTVRVSKTTSIEATCSSHDLSHTIAIFVTLKRRIGYVLREILRMDSGDPCNETLHALQMGTRPLSSFSFK